MQPVLLAALYVFAMRLDADEPRLSSRAAQRHPTLSGRTRAASLVRRPGHAIAYQSNGWASAIHLTPATRSSIFGQTLQMAASVNPGNATGSVTFFSGTTILGIAPLAGGTASFTTLLPSTGTQILKARYTGDANYAQSLSAPVAVTVAAPAGTAPALGGFYATDPNPLDVIVADFNRDGIADLALANSSGIAVSVLLGAGNGVFRSAVSFPCGDNLVPCSPFALANSDFNGDGNPDLAIANTLNSAVSILLGNGDGTFAAAVNYSSGAFFADPYAITIGDFNNDGRSDVAVVNLGDSTVSVLLGNGDGTLQSPLTYPVGPQPTSIVVADFNGDGNADIAAGNSSDIAVSVLLGRGDGTFLPAVPASAGINPFGLVTGDFNGDGKIDLAVADFGDFQSEQGGGVSILLGNGDGTFQLPLFSQSQPGTAGIAACDFNGDGKLDVAVTDINGLSVLLGAGDGILYPAFALSGGGTSAWAALAAGDFNADGVPDLAVADVNLNVAQTLLGTPQPCALALGPSNLLTTALPANLAFTVTTNSATCPWNLSADAWIGLNAYSGVGSASVTATLQSNPNAGTRTGNIGSVNAQIAVTQLGAIQPFDDVPATAYYANAVTLLHDKGITTGCGPTTYCPVTVIPRWQMAVFLVRAIYGTNPFASSPTPYFTDVPTSFPGFAYVQKMYELGITNGCGAGVFCPMMGVTRAQMAIFIIRARLGSTASFTFPATPYFTDVPPGAFGFNWIQRMKLEGITNGCSATSYCPNSPVTRGDMAIFIMRGAFNQLLPPQAPAIASISPASIAAGQSLTLTVQAANTNFLQGRTQLTIPGVTILSISVTSPGTLTAQITADPTAPRRPVSVLASTGAEEAVLPNGLTIM